MAIKGRGEGILFGTDSFMVLQASADLDYWAFFKQALGGDFARIAEENPRRFLGLPETDGGAPIPGTALSRHVAYSRERRAASDRRFGEGAPPAAWIAPLLGVDALGGGIDGGG